MYYKRIQGVCLKIYRSVATAGEKQKQREVFFYTLLSFCLHVIIIKKLFISNRLLKLYHVYHYYIFASLAGEDVTIIEIVVTMHASVYV